MIKVYTQRENIDTGSEMPNFVIWSWMRNGLKLSGIHIMLFAYIFSQSYDNEHLVTTSLSVLSDWFGISRQTLSRNIDALPYVEKSVSQDNRNSFYTHNCYKIDMIGLLTYFQNCEKEIYEEFLAAYKGLLILKFPDDKESIEEYFVDILNLYLEKNPEGIDELMKTILISNMDVEKGTRFKPVLDAITTNGYIPVMESNSTTPKVKRTEESELSVKTKPKKGLGKNPASLGITPKPIRSTRKTPEEKLLQRNENIQKLQLIASNYVAMKVGNDPECLQLLNSYITDVLFYEEKTVNPMSPNSFQTLLKELDMFKTLDDKLDAIRTSIGHRYRGFCYTDKETLNQKYFKQEQAELIQQQVEEFITKHCSTNEDLSGILRDYVAEVFIPTGKSARQFKLFLKKLEDARLSIENMYVVVSETYMNGWKRWSFEFPDHFTSNLLTSDARTASNPKVDMSEKESAIDTFFREHYLYQNPEIKELLLQYIHETKHGQSMSVRDFINKMDYVIMHRYLVTDVINCIRHAVSTDADCLCPTDFNIDKEIKQVHGSFEECLKVMDRERRRQCEVARKKHPDDIRFEGMPMDREQQNRLRNQELGLVP